MQSSRKNYLSKAKAASSIILIITTILLCCQGCETAAKIGQIMDDTGKAGQELAPTIEPLLGAAFPGAGIIYKIATGALIAIGGVLYRVSQKRLAVNQALIEGVSYSAEKKTDLKETISTIATQYAVERYLNKLVQRYDPPKLIKS